MATLVLRNQKGSPLTNSEVDSNFSALNADIATVQGDVSGLSTAQSSIESNLTSLTNAVTAHVGAGDDAAHSSVTVTASGFMTAADKVKLNAISFTPVQQGTGTGQDATVAVKVGKLPATGTFTGLGLMVGATNYGRAWPIDITGNATTATTAANGGVTKVNGMTGDVTISAPTWASVTGKPSGVNITGNWSFAGQGGQTWLWGGDGTNFYAYNPSNFSVNYSASSNYSNSSGYANSAGSAGSAGNGVSGLSNWDDGYAFYIRVYLTNGGYHDTVTGHR